MGTRYGTIVADPPWKVSQPPKKFGSTGNAPLPYATMSLEEIKALPVEEYAADVAHLYLWTVNKYVEESFEVVRAWGFQPSMLLTWCKEPMGIGPGREYASTTEFILFARRGRGVGYSPERIERNWWVWPRAKHSQKPEAFLDLVERVSPGPYLELFARRNRLGWDTFGNEALNHVEIA